jgi:hypothetical protein
LADLKIGGFKQLNDGNITDNLFMGYRVSRHRSEFPGGRNFRRA